MRVSVGCREYKMGKDAGEGEMSRQGDGELVGGYEVKGGRLGVWRLGGGVAG